MQVSFTILKNAPPTIAAQVAGGVVRYMADDAWQSVHITVFGPGSGVWWQEEYNLPFEPVGSVDFYPKSSTVESRKRYFLRINAKGALVKEEISKYPYNQKKAKIDLPTSKTDRAPARSSNEDKRVPASRTTGRISSRRSK